VPSDPTTTEELPIGPPVMKFHLGIPFDPPPMPRPVFRIFWRRLGHGATTAGVTVKMPLADAPPYVAVIVAADVAGTADVVTVKVALVAPAATVTVAGVVAMGSLDDRLTTAPPVPAGPVSVTVPVEGVPPITEAGLRVTLRGTGVVIASVPVTEVVPNLAVIVAVVAVVTIEVEATNVPVVEP